MADGQGISSLDALAEALATGDLLVVTNVSDTTGSDTGTTAKITLTQLITLLDSEGFFAIGKPTVDNQILQATGSGTAAWTSSIDGLGVSAVALTTATTLTTTQVINSVINCGAEATHTLPAPPDGASTAIIPLGTYEVTIEPNGTDVIWLNGVALGAGVNIVGDSEASPCVLTKKSANNWLAVAPNWTEGT